MLEIIPSILTNDTAELEEKLRTVRNKAKRCQIDISDGKFTPNKTIMPDVLENIETDLALDFHLLTWEPVDWVERCVRGLADRIIGQVEMMSSQQDFVQKVSAVGTKVGLALDLPTPVTKIEPQILTNLDVVLLLAAKIGEPGQKFATSVLEKIKKLDEIRIRDDTPFRICVEGALKQNLDEIRQAGADEVVIYEI